MLKIYVASSWRNTWQSLVVIKLREAGFEVYDFRNPRPGYKGFAWSEIDPHCQDWNTDEFTAALNHPLAEEGYKSDLEALEMANAVVLVLPCGRSAHLEAGFAIGRGKPTFVFSPSHDEPELMYKLCGETLTNWPKPVPAGEFIFNDLPMLIIYLKAKLKAFLPINK